MIYQLGFSFSGGLIGMAQGAWGAWTSTAIVSLEKEGILTRSQAGTMTALWEIAVAIICFPTAYMMNFIGRKNSLMVSAWFNVIASVAVLVSNNDYYIIMAKFLNGISSGITLVVLPVYCGEIASVKARGVVFIVLESFVFLGGLISYGIGAYASFFALNISIAIMTVSFVLTFLHFPDSPYYYLMTGNRERARNSLKTYRNISLNDVNAMKKLDEELKEMEIGIEEERKNKGRIIDLVSDKGTRKATIIITILAICKRGGGMTALSVFSTSIMPESGGGLTPNEYMIIFTVLLGIVHYVMIPIVYKFGRKPLLLISTSTSVLPSLAIGIFYMYQNQGVDVTRYNWVVYAGLIAYAITYSLGISMIVSILIGELFPTKVKSYASCMYTLISSAVSCVVDKMFQVSSSSFGVHYMFFLFTFMHVSGFLFTWLYVFETKNLKFAEINKILQSENKIKSGDNNYS